MGIVLLLATAFALLGLAGIGGLAFALMFRRRNRARAFREQRDEHMAMLAEGIERLAEEDPSAVAPPQERPPSVEIRREWGDPPEQGKVFEEIGPAGSGYEGWDILLRIHEGAEEYLGTKAFQTLEARFTAIPGVERCLQEDREVFLFKVATLTHDALRDTCWKLFLEAAGE